MNNINPTILTNINLVDRKVVRRTLRERFLTWPWKPWLSTVTIEVPSDNIYAMYDGRILVCHPLMKCKLMKLNNLNEYIKPYIDIYWGIRRDSTNKEG